MSPRRGSRPKRDRRYGTVRWQAVRRRVLERDLWTCRVVVGCTEPASVADHIIPSFPGMPDALFFSERNLRASCRSHNIARGFAATLEAPKAAASAVVRTDYSRRAS